MMHASGFVFTPREMTQRSENLVTYLFFYVSAAWCRVPWIQMPFMACSEVSSIFSDWWLCWTNIIMITAVTSKLCSCLLWLLLWHLSQENWTYIVVNVIVPISLMDCNSTLQALLSCTLLQTLPELVTPLKGCSLISVQLSPDSVSALWKVWVLIQMWKRYRVKACT